VQVRSAAAVLGWRADRATMLLRDDFTLPAIACTSAEQAAGPPASLADVPLQFLGSFAEDDTLWMAWVGLDATAAATRPGHAWTDCERVFALPGKQAVIARHALRWIPRLHGRRRVCSIVGCKRTSRRFTAEVEWRAFEAGRMAAEAGFSVLTGGLSGVMEQAAAGARSVGGFTVGLLPGERHEDANPHLELVLPSGLGYARNYLMALGGDCMIALPGGHGTLEEICFALDFSRPVISWGSWRLDGVPYVPLQETEPLDKFLAAAVRLEQYQPTTANQTSDTVTI